ncbi:MAG: trypsin-like peptidase domain-containing protein [Cyclobacteriaceae bacterium]|nr:trypsin-like peptidase domain-containing protein [Cyclobacteriaceae bacterium]
MGRKNLILVFIAAVLGGLVAINGSKLLNFSNEGPSYKSIQERQQELGVKAVKTKYSSSIPKELDFTEVSEHAINSVVHIRSSYDSRVTTNGFFQYQQGPSQSSGSGVIVSDDGYIVTNNHVVEDAATVQVVLNDNRSYEAKVIGTDPTTDLALVKIDENNLPFMAYGNSDDVKVGQWVIAVGNPFNLTSTVTAGIISAKARNIGILRDENNLQIESFLQTDAVVNPGNSGGALIDINGRLIGINSAIASPTGSYAGYAFAVPVNLVKKVADDLLEFGVVQRGLLGIRINDVTAELSDREDLSVVQGVYVFEVNENSAAEEAGIKEKDVIVGVDGNEVSNTSELQELVARHRPGDKVTVKLIRGKKDIEVEATLKNTGGNTSVVERVTESEIEGSVFENIDGSEAKDLGIKGGVKLKDLKDGKWKDAGIDEGFIITEVDKTRVYTVEDLKRVMSRLEGQRVLLLGVMENGDKTYYSIDW